MEKTSDSNGKQKVRSAEVGTDILKALAQLSPSTSLSRLAEHVQMPASKVHRYLQALIASGFAEQDRATNHYGLGREALRVGMAALGSIDVLKVAALPLSALRDALTEVARAHGPMRVIVDVDEAISVSPERDRRQAEDPLMAQVKARLEAKLQQLRTECRMYRPDSA